MGVVVTDDLGHYLGVPILHHWLSNSTHRYVVDNMINGVNEWSSKRLSMARRLVLNQSVLRAIPSYTMQTVALINNTCQQIDRIRKRFVWGELESRQVHLLLWERIFQPKKNEGLGIRLAKSYNDALIMKLV